MIAGFILTVALMGMASVASGTLQSVSSSQARQEATTAVTRALESARSLGYDQLALHSDQYNDGELFDWDGPSGDAPSEQYYATSDGLVDGGGFPYFEDRTSYSLVTLVTAHQVQRADGVLVTDPARRVTAVATFSGGRGEVRQSTIVARADRGLPLPAFAMTPVNASLVAVANSAANTVAEVCVPTQLRNQGAMDRYEFTLPSPATHPAAFDYTIRVYQDLGTSGVRDVADVLLSDRTGNGIYTPDTADPLATNDTMELLFCYQRNNYIVQETVTFTIRTHSLFDNDVSTDLEHIITVDDELRLYPQFDLGDDPPPTKGGNFPMSPIVPTRTIGEDYDVDGRVGTYLRRNDNSYVAAFTAVLPAGTTVGGTVNTSMWVASANSTAVGQAASSRTIRLGYTLQVLRADGTVVPPVSVNPAQFVHPGGGWLRQDLAFALPDHLVVPGDRLRLSVRCLEATGVPNNQKSDCHILYDTVTQPATVVVPLR